MEYPILTNSNISALFLFIIIISGNFLGEIFPCKLRSELTKNMYLKHLFGLFTMIFFVVIATSDATDSNTKYNNYIEHIVLTSSALYLIFILITKIPFTFFCIIFILLGGTYLLTLHKQNLIINLKKNNQTQENISMLEITKYENIIGYTYIIICILIFIGVISYMRIKKIEYKNKFEYITFFLGKIDCKDT